MSVPKSKRGKSDMEFLKHAHTLKNDIWDAVRHLPYDYRDDFVVEFHRLAISGESLVVAANEIKVKIQGDLEIRRKYFMEAYATYVRISNLLDNLYETLNRNWPKNSASPYNPVLNPTTVEALQLSIDHELNLILGVTASDVKRYKESAPT